MKALCTLMAVPDRIFVLPVVGNKGIYVVLLVTGTIICAVLLGLLKNRQQKKRLRENKKRKGPQVIFQLVLFVALL